MKKFTFLVGVGAGFVLGSRAGSQPYEQLQARVRKVAGRPEAQRALDQVKGVAREQASAAVHKVNEKRPTSGEAETPAGDADHPAIDPEYIAGGGQDVADRGITGLEV